MPLDKGKLQKLYSTLQQGGYSQSYDEFEKGFTGNDNYPNRKKVYDLLTEHGANIGKTYEDFMGKMQAPPQPSQPQHQNTPAPAPAPKPQPKPKGGGMTAAERAQFIRNAQGIVHQSAAGLQRAKNQMDYANSNRGLKVDPVHLGQNAKVVRRHVNGTVAKPRPVFDVAPEQQPGDTYLTESGNEFASRAEADTEQNAVDQYRYDQSETGQLNNAYAEAERLDKLLEQHGKELDDENRDKWWRDLPRGGGGAVSTMNANDNNGRMTDTEYLNLLAARKKVDEQIRDLKAARDEKTGTFLGGLWRGFRDYAFDPSNWDNGYSDLLTTSAMLRAKTEAAQTPREKASERMMMEDTYKAGVAAQQAEKVLGNGYRFMRIGAQSLPFALQFMAGNATGMIGGLTRAGEGMGVKLARKIAIKQGANNMMRNIGRSVLKNTGVMLGDLGAATALTTTIQAGQTGADIGQRYAGDVTYDPKTDDYKLEGGKSLGRSIYEGVANSTIENYTEQLGEHMHLGKFASSALTKMGLGRVSNWFTKVGKTDFMQGVNKYMKMAGFNGYPQEVMEEEVGIPLHAIFDGGNKMSDLLDGRQQLDIVGGMLFSMAGMGGASMVMQGGHKAAMAVQYHQDQHKLDNADKIASLRLTADKWAPIKDEIDGTTNEDFGKVMKDVLSNDELSDQEKQAVWDYAQRLVIMRGHNMGQEAATRNGMTDKETNTANESYTQGYNTTDATAMNDAKNRLAAAQQKFDEYMEQTGRERWEGEPSMQDIQHRHRDAQSLLNDKWADDTPVYNENDEEYKLAQAVVNAQQEYEGMMQRVRDDIDDEVQQTGAIYDSRTNSNGMIQSATLKAQNPDGTDKKVYITSGNVVMTDDGKSVDNQKSDMSIVVVDEDGKVQMISPDELFSLDTPIDGAQAKQQAIDAIQQSKAQEAADKINGKVNLTAGNTYTLTDNTGQQIAATIVADGQTGAVQNPDGTVNVSMNGKVVAMDVNTLQQMVDNTNMQRTAQGDEDGGQEQPTEQEGDEDGGQEQPTEQEGDQGILDQGGTVEPEGGTVVPEGGNIVDLSNIGEGEGEEGGGTVVQGDEVSGAVPTYPGGVVAPDMSEPHQWQVDDTFTIDNGGMPIRGQVTGVGEDGVEIYTESPVNGKKMQVVSPEELQSMTTEINGETVQAPQDEAAAEQRPTEPSPTEQSGVNGVNGEQAQEQAPQTQEQAQPQQADGEQPARAIDRIPSQQIDDGKGNVRTVHSWEQAEPGDTYDALTEIYHGNADRVKKGIDNRVGKIDKAIKGVHKQMDAIDNSDDFDEVAAQSEQYDQLQQQKDELEKQKKYWQGVQMVPRNRKMDADRRSAEEQAAAKAAQEKAEAEAAEKARQEREQVNGVPDVVNDIPADARKRGFRNVNGMVVNRQGETQGVSGRESNVKFSSTDTAKGHIKVIDADELQPSHVSGQRNPSFFIDEAQPKDRTDTVSGMAAAKIAADLNPEEITGDGSAYQFSAPTVNSRGEVIQGNNRSDALKLMYSNPAFKPAQDAYKQYIADHAEEFGFTPEDVAKIQQMAHPVMVNELDVPDDEAIRLGQMRASDNESGGIERIDPVTTSQKLGGKVSSFANVLLSSPDEDASLSDVLMQNGAKAVNWLATQGAISDTAAQSAFDKKGNLTPEARMDLQNILKQSLFQGGVSDLPTMFDKMPTKAQKAILSTFMRDFDSAESERILPEIQRAIEAWYDCAMSKEAFAKASNYKGAKNAMHDWERQTNMLDDNMPSDKFSNFARELACRLQGCSMRETQQSLNDFFDLVQGKSQGDLFGGTTMGEQADRQESIRRIFNIEYKPISNGKTRSNAVADNSSQSGEGRQGSPTDGKGRERAESGSGSANGAGGTESHDEEGIKATHVDTYGHGFRTIYKNLKTGKVTVIFGEGDKANRNGGKYNVRTAAEQQPTEPSGDSSHRNDSSHSIGSTSSSEKKETERQGVNTEPTEKQKEAGNYKKGHIKVDGYDITIENPKGSTRSGKDASGKAWSVPMHYDYGYIKGTEGVDGDHIDVYLSDNPTSGKVYVIDQIDQKTGKFDEHKVMYGLPSKEAAVEAYKSQYEKGWKVGTVTEVSREDFKKWVESSKRKTKPFSEYKSVKDAAAMRQPTEQKATEQTSGQGTTEQQPAVITTDDEKGKEKPIETKPEKELSGDSAEYQQRQIQEKNFVIEIQNAIEDDAAYGKYDHKLTMSDIKKMAQKYDLLKDYKDTDMQELVERAMTLATRQVAQADINKDEQTKKAGFDEVVRLYQSQPSLNARDTSRVAHQQYSTPTPFGYVMDMFMMGGDKKPLKLLEPSAGNGALTIGIPAPLWHVNDIDERRLMNLRTMPYGRITNQDGTMPFEPKAYDAVATNPPFGNTQEKEFDGGRTKISSLEGLMAINALASMKDDGRAAIIIGGNTQYMSNGAMQAKDMKLFKYLYTHYNVVDVINLDGDMYKRNGTGYNVRMILIAGRKTDVGDNPVKFTYPPVKKKARAEQVKTFDELYKRVEDDIQQAKQMEREPSAAVNSDGSQPVNSASERTGNSEAAGGVQQQPVRAGEMERRPQPGRSVRPSSAQDGRGNGERSQHGSADRLDNADGRNAGSNHAVQGNRPSQGQSSERRAGGSTGRGTVGGDNRGGTSERNNTTGERPAITKNAEAQPQRTEPHTPQAPREKVALGQEKVAYPAKSQSMTLQSRVPAAQAEAIAENLDKLGDVDEMVRSELGYSSKDELYSHLAAEQIDSVALAINQMKHGKGFIIGDMTGVGKGRQGAALIRWAIKQGKTPIYFTQKARLYTDNYRDMCDIGSNGLRPFLIASNDDGNIVENVVDENGEKVYDKNGEPVTRVVYGLPKPKERERVYDYILQNGKLPPEYDYVLVTYSQIQSGTKTYEIGKNGEIEVKDKKYKGKTPGADKNGDIRRDVLETLAKDNYVFLDESHTVGGQSSSGLYMQDLLKGAEGVTYLSATFAKRPDNMSLYAMKTAMSESGLSQKDMIDAIQNGGVTLQEIMSKQLVQSGQMIRRERDFTGVSIDWEGVDEETDKQQRAQFDEVAKIFNAIREFQDNYVDPSIEKMSEDMAEEGMFSKKTQGTSHMGVNNVPFASKMYNLVNQLLFSLKANAVADKAIECLKKGEKPVISFNNTMEGFLDDMPRNTPMPELPNFSLTLMRALEGTLRYTEGEVGNKDNQVNKTLNINDLGDEAVAKYNEIRKTILNLSIGLPIDPMDAIKMRIEAAGYKVGEITGRKSEMVMDAEGNYIVQSRSSKEMDGKTAASAFNSASGKNGGLDVLLINKSGSTGISLHASSKFSDQSPRVMIAAQFQSDINDEVQMRGRIDRTGQVHRGRYIYLVSSIPAEQRLQMMFKNKLKSLDANTTSSQKSKFNEMEVTDFMNKYGDEVTWSYMMEHPDLEDRLGDPLDMLSDESKKSNRRGGDEENNPNSGCAGKILRRLPFLSVKEQEQIFNDLADAYKVKMQILNDAGENDLEITTMPLRAETKSRKVWKQGSDPGSDNAFADNTYLETAEVDVLKKPMKAKEAREYADRLTDGKPWEQWHEEQHEAVEKFYADKAKAVEDKAKAEAQKRINKAREDYIKGCLKARKKGDNNWSDEEISHMADIAAKEAADKEQTKINKRTVSIDAQRNDVLGALDAFTPLEPLIIPLNLKDTSTTVIPSLGTFLGIKFGKGYSRSSSTAVFATLDGRRKIEVPLSDKTSLENIKHQSIMLGYQARGLNMDNWDSKVPTKSRKTAYIVTGNLMQALVDTQKSPETKGQLISYTTIDGDVKQGILMNDRFKEEDLKTSVPISAMLQKIKEGDAVESTDKEVKIERGTSYHYNDYKLSVPKSKSRGGKYFLDQKLLRLLDDEFTTSGGNMVSWVSESNLKKVLDYLSKTLGVTVQVKANLEETADSPHNDEPATPSEAEEGGVLYREVDDEEAARLDSEPTVKVYRAMQKHDGKLYPPMSGRVKTQVETKNGTMRTKWVWRSPIEIGKWEQSEEHPEMANEDRTFTLDKGNGSKINAAYNPYIHTSRTPINDQFSSAWNRPELVTVEVEVPASELTSGYHAEKAKDVTGEVEWKSGPVGREMAAQGNPRMVILSRWDKPVRIVPVDEVADEYAVRLAGTGIKVPFNTVPPALRDALVARGVEISEPEEGNAGKASRPSYEEWLKGNTRRREGSGAYSDEELSLMNDPVAKWLGKSNRTKAQQKAFAHRERKSMESAAKELADRLHLDNVNIVMDTSTLKERKSRAKGFYDRNTNEITIVIPNHRDVEDVMQTLLHEGVAHYGLRKMFGSHFDTFLDNVYAAADNDVRRRITELALSKYGGDFRVATEEYLASLAEQTDFEHIPETFWQKIKDFFLDMLHAIGFADFADKYDFTLSDNELRYILWRSYENLKEPGRYRSILGEAEDVAKQAELQVGNYAPESLDSSDNRVAEASPKLSSVKNEFGKPFVLSSKGSIDMGFIDKASGLKEAPIRLSEGEDIVDEDGKHHGYGLLHIAAEHEGEIRNASYNSVEEFVEDVASNYNTIREGNVVANNQTYLVELTDKHNNTLYVELSRDGKYWNINSAGVFRKGYSKNKKEVYSRPAIGSSSGTRTAGVNHGVNNSATVTSGNSPLTSNAKIGNNSERGVNNSENVSEPKSWGKQDLMSKAEQISNGIEPDLLFRDTIEDDDNTARETYDRWADQAKEQFREAWQDSMINVRNLQEAVLKQRGEKLEPYEDAYNEENRSHGIGQDKSEYFTDNLYKPLIASVNEAAKKAKVSIGDVTTYMMAKHGLERNEAFAKRDADAAWTKYQEKQKAKFDEYQKAHPNGKQTLADFIKKSYDDFYNDYREKDYSGLTSLTDTDNVQDAEAEAQRIIADMERKTDTKDIWDKVNAATKWTLHQAHESGIISKDNYQSVKDMFKYYIPLRGWNEDTAGDIYDYVGSAKGTAFSPTLAKAKGRKSQADNPIAYIGSMGISAIIQGERNRVKQAFMRFAENHPTNLVMVSEMWYRNFGTDTAPDWREDVPNIPENTSADQVAAIVEQHEKDMKALEAQGLATKRRGRLHLGVPIKPKEATEHHVEVMLNGKKYVLYINGNPRTAQALNGTRAKRAQEHSTTAKLDDIAKNFEDMHNWIGRRLASLTRMLAHGQRWMGARFTSKNPAFILSNAMRDVDMALASTAIKESPMYALRFRLNLARLVGPVRMLGLKHWYENYRAAGGNSAGLTGLKKYFYEFNAGGARTGFTSLKDIKDYKKEIEKMVKQSQQSVVNPRRWLRVLGDGFEFANSAVEDMTRFATFMASRQSGRTVRESVTDAKNITLNFNRKGSGEMGNATIREMQIFVNPAIQSLQTIASLATHHPVKFSAYTALRVLIGIGTPFATSLLWSIFGGGNGDDDDWNAEDEYWKLPTWTRRSNFVCWIPGTHKFLMIPLAQEFRVMNGFGETIASAMTGNSDENPALEMLSQTSGLLPIDFTGNGNNPFITLSPTIIQPLMQIRFNTDFTGRPIYKDSEWNKYEPASQKAYIGTPGELVDWSAKINNHTGGNEHKQGWWERTLAGKYANNPAIVDHFLKGYYGGLYSFIAQLGGLAFHAYNGESPDVQEIPMANRLVTAPREKLQNGKMKMPVWYYDMLDDNKRYMDEVNGYRKDMLANKPGAEKHFMEMTKTDEFMKQQQVNALMNGINQIRAAMPTVENSQNDEDAKTKQELEGGIKEILSELEKIRKTGKPLE